VTVKTILFVCTGNTCRSIMAEAIAKQYLAQSKQGKPEIQVISAGTAAIPDEPASEHAQTVLSLFGMNLQGHKARSVRPELIQEADLILVMTQRHKEHILRLVPDAEDKVYLIKEYARENEQQSEKNNEDIIDPFGLPLEYYQACAEELRVFVNKAVDRLLTDIK